MTEKWLKNYRSLPRLPKRAISPVSKLFADSDRDGVPNVFDCQPRNRRKQDALAPFSMSANPVQEMLQRQEYARQQTAALKAQREWEAEQTKIQTAYEKSVLKELARPEVSGRIRGVAFVRDWEYPQPKQVISSKPGGYKAPTTFTRVITGSATSTKGPSSSSRLLK